MVCLVFFRPVKKGAHKSNGACGRAQVVMSHLMRNFDIVSHTHEDDVKIQMGLVSRIANFRNTITRRNRK